MQGPVLTIVAMSVCLSRVGIVFKRHKLGLQKLPAQGICSQNLYIHLYSSDILIV